MEPKIIVPVEFVPTLLGFSVGSFIWFRAENLAACLCAILIGLSIQIILMLYRTISGIVTMLSTFSDAADAIPKIHQLLAGVLTPGTPKGGR